jgi:hypothetical protein
MERNRARLFMASDSISFHHPLKEKRDTIYSDFPKFIKRVILFQVSGKSEEENS